MIDSQERETDEYIRMALGGDSSGFAALYDYFLHPIYRLAFGILLDHQDAEEVVQDSFAYAFRNLASYDPKRSAFRTWLYTITMSRCRNKRRRKWLPVNSEIDVLEGIPDKTPRPEALVEQRGIRETVRAALSELSPKLREAIVLRYFDGLSYKEMAEVLRCPQKTAESRVRLAHKALYSILGGHGEISAEEMLSA